MRTLVIGDIHGCSTALRTLLDIVQPGPDDVLVTLGDYVDRGPDSKGVLETLIGLEKTTQLKPIMGNHEILFLEALNQRMDPEGWLRVGGRETMHSYAGSLENLCWDQVTPAHIDFLSQRCLRYYEDESNMYVHANANAYFSLADQSDDWLFWTRFDDVYPHTSGKRIICGHTAQKSGLPNVKSYAVCLDTWAYGQGWLTCMDVTAETFVQVNQAGAVRRTSIQELSEPPTANTMRIPLPKI
ncbi:MAG: metallophosphoesterase family protein [Verrucomicrobiota bacterium]